MNTNEHYIFIFKNGLLGKAKYLITVYKIYVTICNIDL